MKELFPDWKERGVSKLVGGFGHGVWTISMAFQLSLSLNTGSTPHSSHKRQVLYTHKE